jgi:lysophospholipase L1-like esterase
MTNAIPSREADLLQRSAFLLLLLGALVTLIAWLMLINTPASAARHVLYLGSVGALFIATLGGMVFILRAPLARLQQVTGFVTRLFGHPTLALALTLVIMVAIAFLVPIFSVRFPNLVVFNVLLISWGALAIALLAICNAGVLAAALASTSRVWVTLGVGFTLLSLLALIFVAAIALMSRAEILTRAPSTHAELVFYGNEVNPELSQAYWTEFETQRPQWLSYTSTRVKPSQGQFITVDSAGRRGTASFVGETEDAPDVFFFGGSTVWGEGARDAYTIPSQVAQLLAEASQPIRAVNFGQIGYISTQDLILFQRQLALGKIPDVAVFYQGNNEISSVFTNGNSAGLPANELNRIRDLMAGTLLRENRPVLRQLDADLRDIDLSLVGIPNATPAQIVDMYLENVRQARLLAEGYGVPTLFIWQPALIYKQNLTAVEQQAIEESNGRTPGYEALYRAVDEDLRRRLESGEATDILMLTDLFALDSRYLFVDRVHVTEDANATIAQAILPALLPLLDAES